MVKKKNADDRGKPTGFRCQQCGSRTRVVVSQTTDPGGFRVYRRRECKNPSCGYRFGTKETPVSSN